MRGGGAGYRRSPAKVVLGLLDHKVRARPSDQVRDTARSAMSNALCSTV
jgi:hypothetical protein